MNINQIVIFGYKIDRELTLEKLTTTGENSDVKLSLTECLDKTIHERNLKGRIMTVQRHYDCEDDDNDSYGTYVVLGYICDLSSTRTIDHVELETIQKFVNHKCETKCLCEKVSKLLEPYKEKLVFSKGIFMDYYDTDRKFSFL